MVFHTHEGFSESRLLVVGVFRALDVHGYTFASQRNLHRLSVPGSIVFRKRRQVQRIDTFQRPGVNSSRKYA
jgi:hypothetical protein